MKPHNLVSGRQVSRLEVPDVAANGVATPTTLMWPPRTERALNRQAHLRGVKAYGVEHTLNRRAHLLFSAKLVVPAVVVERLRRIRLFRVHRTRQLLRAHQVSRSNNCTKSQTRNVTQGVLKIILTHKSNEAHSRNTILPFRHHEKIPI